MSTSAVSFALPGWEACAWSASSFVRPFATAQVDHLEDLFPQRAFRRDLGEFDVETEVEQLRQLIVAGVTG